MSEPGPPSGRRAAARPTVSVQPTFSAQPEPARRAHPVQAERRPRIRDPRTDDGPTVWSRCERCGQLRHVTALRCPSCGLTPAAESADALTVTGPVDPEDSANPAEDLATAELSAVELHEHLHAPTAPVAPAATPAAPAAAPAAPPPAARPAPHQVGQSGGPSGGQSGGHSGGQSAGPGVGPSAPAAQDPDDAARIIASLVARPTARTGPAHPAHPRDPDRPAGSDVAGRPRALAARRSGSPRPALPSLTSLARRTRSAWDQAGIQARRRPGIAAGAVAGLGVLLLLVGVLVNGATSQASPSGSSSGAAVRPVRLSPTSAGASSTQNAEGGVRYDATNTLDGRPETAWNSDGRRDGKGPGMALTYTFDAPVDVQSVTVLNGYQKLTPRSGKPALDLYPINARVRTVRVVTDGGSATWNLKDVRDPQTLPLRFGRTSTVRLEIIAVYPGSRYLDLALSEVSFTGLP